MSIDKIERLYKNYGILADAENDIAEHAELYSEILDAVKGNERERRLACQFIPRFFKSFPDLAERAIEAIFDLCEDPEICIRKQVIKELPSICRDCKSYTKRTADILSQLLQAKDPNELLTVHNSFLILFQNDPEGAVGGIFNQIRNGDDGVRDKCLHFLSHKVKSLPFSSMPKLEDTLIGEIKASFEDASPEEIPIFMDILIWTKLGKDVQGHNEIVNLIADQIESEKPFQPADDDLVERLIIFCKSVKPLFKPSTCPIRFIVYFCEEILPNFKDVNGYEDCNGNALELLQLFAEMTLHCQKLTNPSVVQSIYKLLLVVMPYSEGEIDNFQEVKFQFSYVECLLFSFHKLFKLYPDIFGENNELTKFRARLQYFSRALQGYIRTLNTAIKQQSADDEKTPENEIKAIALKTTTNINSLIKDFFHTPPVNKAFIQLSWIIPKATNGRNVSKLKKINSHHINHTASKRPHVVSSCKTLQRPLYQPPNGKYSKTFCQPKSNGLTL